MKKNLFALGSDVAKIGVFALALGLVACGDDSGSNSGTNGVKGEVITLADGSGEKVCDDKLEGWVAEAVGKDFRRCQNGEWTKITANEASAEDEIIGGVTVLQSSSSSVIPSEVEGSSNSLTSSSSVESSSSVVSSSSEKSSSSVASSSSVKSSSSVASSSSAKSSSSSGVSSSSSSSNQIENPSCSSKANWAYLNPNIDYGEFTDERDGQVYKTVKIGTQTWMAENLNYDPGDVSSMGDYAWSGCYGDGGYDYSSGKNLTDEKVAANCSKYGRLYTWEVAMDKADCAYGKICNASLDPTTPVRGVCPSGWHLPSHREFETLINYVDPSFGYNHTSGDFSSKTGMFLKSKSGWTSDRNGFLNGNGTDVVGFSALPGGYRNDYGNFYQVGLYAYFLSSGEYNSYEAFFLRMGYHSEVAYLDRDLKFYAFSVRCLRD